MTFFPYALLLVLLSGAQAEGDQANQDAQSAQISEQSEENLLDNNDSGAVLVSKENGESEKKVEEDDEDNVIVQANYMTLARELGMHVSRQSAQSQNAQS